MERIIWTFNTELLQRLPLVLDLTAAKIADRIGLCQQTFNRFILGEVTLSVQQLLQLINSLRMPSGYFISENGVSVIPLREEATLPPDKWKPVKWDCSGVDIIFGGRAKQIHWKQVSVAMGISKQRIRDRFMLSTRFPVDDFLAACTKLQLSPYTFLKDENDTPSHRRKQRPKTKGVPDGFASAMQQYTPEDFAQLRSEMAALRREMETLRAEIAAQKQHRSDGSYLMAAEDDNAESYGKKKEQNTAH